MSTSDACVFCEIVRGAAPAHIIWQDSDFMAFLSIFPNTPGVSVLIPKMHYSSYAFEQTDELLADLVSRCKIVAKLLDANLDGVGRTAMVLEGFGVDHLHAKLFPMHGTRTDGPWKRISSKERKFFTKYEGYISSHDSERAEEDELKKIADKIRA